MGKVIAGMTMSLDGFISDSNGDLRPLYSDFETFVNSELTQESIRTTGAVVMGRRTFAMGEPNSYADDYEFQTPIFVLTHTPPDRMPKQNENLTFTFVTDGIESAIRQAKQAAGEKDVTIVGGASTIQQCLRAGLCDELHVDIRYMLMGRGIRFFEHLEEEQFELTSLGTQESAERTHLRFRVGKR